MKRIAFISVCIMLCIILTACGGGIKNDTPVEAAKTLMNGMVEGDRDLIDQINHSDSMSFPTDYMLDLANSWDLVGMDLKDFKFEQDEKKERRVNVMYKDGEGEEQKMTLIFNKEKEGYFFYALKKY